MNAVRMCQSRAATADECSIYDDRQTLYDDRQTCVVVGRDSSVMETRAAIASVATRGAWGVFCTTSIYIGRVSTSVRTKVLCIGVPVPSDG